MHRAAGTDWIQSAIIGAFGDRTATLFQQEISTTSTLTSLLTSKLTHHLSANQILEGHKQDIRPDRPIH